MKLKQEIKIFKRNLNKQTIKIRQQNQIIRRRSEKIASLTEIIEELGNNNLVTYQISEVLAISASNNDLLNRYLFKSVKLPKVYEPQLRILL